MYLKLVLWLSEIHYAVGHQNLKHVPFLLIGQWLIKSQRDTFRICAHQNRNSSNWNLAICTSNKSSCIQLAWFFTKKNNLRTSCQWHCCFVMPIIMVLSIYRNFLLQFYYMYWFSDAKQFSFNKEILNFVCIINYLIISNPRSKSTSFSSPEPKTQVSFLIKICPLSVIVVVIWAFWPLDP